VPARLIFSTGSLHPLDTAECFALAAEAGFDGVEVMCDLRWSTLDPAGLAELAARYGLPVLAVHTPFSAEVPGWERPQDQVRRIELTVALAEALGAEVAVVHLPERIWLRRRRILGRTVRVPQPSDYRHLKGWVERELPRAQARTSVKIALENLPSVRLLGWPVPHVWWNTVPQWSRIHDHLTLDTTHWATQGVDPLAAYRAAGRRVAHVHLSNYDGRQHRLPHRGALDLAGLLRAMAADGFEGAVSAELQPDSLEHDDKAALRRNLRETVAFCRAHLAGA
jgi:sugar phosphate isomerase/epimerase